MKRNQTLHTRRSFLRTTVLGGAATFTVPAFLDQTFLALQAQAAGPVQATTGKDGRILVVLQLAGGNDGLNTVVPFEDDAYYEARPRLAIPKNEVLRVSDSAGFHPGMPNFEALSKEGMLSVVQGVGYPNPNRSHFRSTEIWATASDANRNVPHGWLGRYFDSSCSGSDASAGIALENETPQTFRGEDPHAICFSDPAKFRFQTNGSSDPEALAAMVEEMSESYADPAAVETGSTIGMVTGGNPAEQQGDVFDFLRRTSFDAQVTSDEVVKLAKQEARGGDYPNTRLARDLEFVGRMIEGGMPTRVYYVSLGGFDTHANQAGSHQRLVGELDGAVAAFLKDLERQGNLERTVLMTFSEFGRRVAENGSNGTDHGAAAPLFLAGGTVKPGFHGAHPSLTDLHRGDLKHGIDFRSVYAAVIEDWLGADSKLVLGKSFPKASLFS